MNICPKWEMYLARAGSMDPMKKLIRELDDAGRQVVSLLDGDPGLYGWVNEDLSKALVEAANGNWTMYPQNTSCLALLKNAIADFERTERKVECNPDKVIVAPGVAAVLRELSYALLKEGDEILTFNPSHFLTGPTSYWSYLGAKCVSCSTSGRFEPDLDELRGKIGNRTKAIFINSPNNPTGVVYPEKILKQIVDISGEHDLPIISDEIYGLITYDGIEAKSTARIAKDVPVFILSGMSKIFMATGWRIGYMYVHDPMGKLDGTVNAIGKIAGAYGHGTLCLPTPILVAATNIYKKGAERGRTMVKALQKTKDYTTKRLNEMDHISCVNPQGGFYAFPKVHTVGKKWKTDLDFVLHFLKEENIAFVHGSKYGSQGFGHFRTLFLPRAEQLEDIYNRLEKFLEKN